MGNRLLRLIGSAIYGVKPYVYSASEPQLCRHWRRLVGVVLAACFASLLAALWHPVYRFTGLLQVGQVASARALAVVHEQPVFVYEEGYDGQYYAQLACDPTLRAPELRTAIDTLPYRARRILMPALAWTLGLGRPERAIQIYPWLNIVCWFALALVLWPVLQADRRWLGVAAWAGVLFSAGALTSVRYSLTDLPALLLLALALRAAQAGKPRRMAAWFGAGLLARETLVVGAWGLCPKACDKPSGLLRMAGWIVLAGLPLGLWLIYIGWQVGQPSGGTGNFAPPLCGLIGRWRESLAGLHAAVDPRLAWTSLLATIAVTAQLLYLAISRDWRSCWWRLGCGSALLALVLGSAVWEGFPGATPRVLLPLLLACNVLAIERRHAAFWLLLFNLSVPSGLLELEPMPDLGELAAVRSSAGAAVLRTGEGCYAPESLRKDRWVWTAQDAHYRLRIWPAACDAAVGLAVRVRALDERELVVSWAGGELWRGRIGRDWSLVRLPVVQAKRGELVLKFHSDSLAVRAGSAGDARSFSVCLRNPQIELCPPAGHDHSGD
jgi:hypothetical protein